MVHQALGLELHVEPSSLARLGPSEHCNALDGVEHALRQAALLQDHCLNGPARVGAREAALAQKIGAVLVVARDTCRRAAWMPEMKEAGLASANRAGPGPLRARTAGGELEWRIVTSSKSSTPHRFRLAQTVLR